MTFLMKKNNVTSYRLHICNKLQLSMEETITFTQKFVFY